MCSENDCQCGGQTHRACETEFQYAVKVVCGEVVANPKAPSPPVAPGVYRTATNIHNPSNCDAARLRWKVAIALPGKPGPVSVYTREVVLGPDQALEVDCAQVMQAFPPPTPKFIKGFLVVSCDRPLDVVAVYTGAQAADGPLHTFHTERVEGRCVDLCEELILPLHTGLANWQTISPSVGPVALVNPFSWTTPPPFGSSWVSEKSTDGVGGATGTRIYELCFDLCFGYIPPTPFSIQLLTDGYPSKVFLNSPNLIGVAQGWNNPTTLSVNPAFLRAGRNCFRVEVPNGGHTSNPTGFALAGFLRVARGKCPCKPLPIAKPASPTGAEPTPETPETPEES